MTDVMDRLAGDLRAKLITLGFSEPRVPVLRRLLEVAYLTTLRTEEGRFTRSSITFALPAKPDVDPPLRRRAAYPAFTRFKRRLPFTVDGLAKLSRAIDKWSASIAVHGTRAANISVWGVLDQLVQQSIRLNRESDGGFVATGILTITMDRVGDLSAYHRDIFLGGLRAHTIVKKQHDPFRSTMLWNRVMPTLIPAGTDIARALPGERQAGTIVRDLFAAWCNTIARLCIGLKRLGTGGAYLLTPRPVETCLAVNCPFEYLRLRDALVLSVLETAYLALAEERHDEECHSGTVRTKTAMERALAETDAKDRASELSGAIKLVTSLAALDGVVLMTPQLKVLGFNAKISSAVVPSTVYDAAAFSRKGTAAMTIDLSKFGTRHGSILGYCRRDPSALGIIVSQDGRVRIAGTWHRSLVLWDDAQLLNHRDYSPSIAQSAAQWRRGPQHRLTRSLGYTSMPKTMTELARRARQRSAARSS